MIDLDNLKIINDAYGHNKGDEYIIKAANCLSKVVRKSDIISRFGGDEFTILAVETDLLGGNFLFNKIKESFIKHNIKASIGMAMRNPELGLNQALKEADREMYKEKLIKKERYV